ncbi:hypothetical protein [Flavobacterium chilense]|uniref:Uncharacterized protein n=1 Tax=Flavobacterium chilense TaxID=946677 RepID=A0A1M7IRV3_9FLAO|nr:hypothetical protein [Flavobacterium chilense]SHM43338.1 hypothetical protein SAMN05444484_10620 [Flavobacterium chilense]
MKQPKIYFDKETYTSVLSQSILEAYWQNIAGKFTLSIDEISKRFELNSKEITAIVSSTKSHIDFGICNACGEMNFTCVENRTKAKHIFENFYYYFFCFECRKKVDKFCKNLNDSETKIVWMRLSFKYQLWKELDIDEMNFLKAIYYLKSWNRIYHEVIKLDLDYSFKVLFKLDKMHLIYYNKDQLTGQVKIKIMEDLQSLITNKNI